MRANPTSTHALRTALAPGPPEPEVTYLDRPQWLGFWPTTAFWKRRDVWRIAGPPTGIFVFLWLMLLDIFVNGSTPMWASGMLAGIGPYLFVGSLERYLRFRLRRRRSLELPPAS
jgi:hypothetical protein